jgi:hypothetical protein
MSETLGSASNIRRKTALLLVSLDSEELQENKSIE